MTAVNLEKTLEYLKIKEAYNLKFQRVLFMYEGLS